jgi:prolyl-tRNA synthetase
MEPAHWPGREKARPEPDAALKVTRPVGFFWRIMRFSELHIQTQRQAPSRSRSEGAAFLRRAGYVDAEGELTLLGKCMSSRMEEVSRTHTPRELFGLLELPVILAEAAEYFYETTAGRHEILQCPSGDYAARRELARVKPMPVQLEPALPIEKVATPDCSTIESLASFLHVPKEKTAKALMYTRGKDGQFVFVVIRGDMQVSEQKLRQAVGEVRAATADEVVASGAAPGYASPIGLKTALIVVDQLITESANLVAGANEPGFHYRNTNYGRDYGSALVADLGMAQAGDPCPDCGKPLSLLRGDLLASSSGYQIGNIMEALAEAHHDDRGLAWPAAASPFDVYLLHLPGKELDTRGRAHETSENWQAAGITVLLDDRDERAGVKFTDADLIGLPVRATVGERGLKDGMVELKSRTRAETQLVPYAEAVKMIRSLTTTA